MNRSYRQSPLSALFMVAACIAAYPRPHYGEGESVSNPDGLKREEPPVTDSDPVLGGLTQNQRPANPFTTSLGSGGTPPKPEQAEETDKAENLGLASERSAELEPSGPIEGGPATEGKATSEQPSKGDGVAAVPSAAPTTVHPTEVVPPQPSKSSEPPVYSADFARRTEEGAKALTDIKTEEDEKNAEGLLQVLGFCADKTPDRNVTVIFKEHINRIHGMLVAFRDQKK